MANRPDIIIVMTDEERAVPPYESAEVLAWRQRSLTGRRWFDEHGISFTRHYTGSLACVPSRPTIFTGQYPDLHGVTQTDGIGKRFDDSRLRWLRAGEVPTLGNWFRAAGYDTHYDGKWHISHADLEDPATGAPLATNDNEGVVDSAAVRRYLDADPLGPYGFSGWVGPEPHGAGLANSGFRRDPLVADRVVAWLTERYARRRAGDTAAMRPFLLVASFVNPHDIVLFPAWVWRSPLKPSPLDPPHRTQKLRSQTNGGKDRHQLTYEQFARMLTLMGPSDLWTVERAARHWGVSASRARAILSSRHIHRVSGYPAQAIKAVTLRQGARTDLKTANHLVPAAQAFTMAETGAAIGETEDERARLRIFFEFLRGADETGTSALDLIVDEPALIGEHRFDALLAAAAEYISARWGRPGPLWSVSIERFLDTAWWVSDLPSARAFAAVWTPAPFRRRGIYLDRHDLTSDGVCVMPEPVFNRTELQRAFTALAAKLERRGVVGQVHVVGGAAMLLAYNSRVTTRDIDALFSTDGPMLEAIREVADEMGWPRTWLNNQASGYVSRTPGEGAPVFDHPFLHVVATPAQHLLAMKVVAARGVRDGEDIRLLLDRLRITSAAGVWEIVARYFPAETITDRSRLLVEDLLNQ